MTRLALGLLAAATLTSCSLECTNVGCTSTLEIQLEHSTDLASGPYLLEVSTPLQELRCSVGPEPTGDRSCFGFRFADLTWDDARVTLLLTEPFVDGPFESVEVVWSREGVELARQTLMIDAGASERPNGPDCPGECWRALGVGSL